MAIVIDLRMKAESIHQAETGMTKGTGTETEAGKEAEKETRALIEA
jgi:hypothetical protein